MPTLAATVPAANLTMTQRRQGILALMTSTFFSWGGFFLVIPLIAVHYVDHLGWTAGSIGIVLALRQLTQQGFTAFFGVLCDRIGPKPLIATGMLVRASGFAAMAFAESFWPVLASALLAGFGGSMFEAPKAASLAALSRPEERRRLFSIVGVVSGVGTTIGTQLGAFLIRADFRIVCLAGASAYVIIFAVMIAIMPNVAVSTASNGAGSGSKLVLRDRTFLLFLLLLSGYWFTSSQFGLAIVLYAADLTGTDSSVSWLYLVNTLITVGLGYFLPRWLERWLSPLGLLIVGMFVLAVGVLLVGFAGGVAGLLVASAVFSLGAVLARPGQETVTANLADPSARGAYFGVAALSLALGGGLGNYLGGVLYDLGKQDGMALVPWTIFCFVGCVAGLGMILQRRQFGIVRGLGDIVEEEVPLDRARSLSTATPEARIS